MIQPIHRSKTADSFDDHSTAMHYVVSQYSDINYKFANLDNVQLRPGIIDPEIFYPLYKGANNFSEFSAIEQYQESRMFDDYSEMFGWIAFIEMTHLDHLGDLIRYLGGRTYDLYYANEDLSIFTNLGSISSTIQAAIENEQATIKEYEKVIIELESYHQSTERDISIQQIEKIISDEQKHVLILSEAYNNLKL